ncbi:MAG: hypothetical protein IKW96_08475 [Ruminococcus sp.]|uniref:DUF6985 domain-containing protein n=1 Tax=Ruminococcus sp. TaxID=41978 RepID=UPI0025D8EDE5|nr:hypothetical protein [Ruminococcus sp.]MBR5683298.1 hypothetical protein [Ruminococcus sp.]
MIESLETTIWGRKFTLPVEYDCYEGEEVTKAQIQALKNFRSHTEWIEKSRSIVEKYCREQVMSDEENTKKDNIFSYIKPECLFVKRDKESPRIAMMCKYRYDLEHGLAVVFSSDGEVTVGMQDIIL